jgi:hypothetical protein
MVEFLVGEAWDDGDEAAEPSRGDCCSSLPGIDFAKEAAFTCWMTVQRKFISEF